MGMSADDYLGQLKALLPPGAAWRGPPGGMLNSMLAAWAEEFARLEARAEALQREADPRGAAELLPDWERTVGFAAADAAGLSLSQRQQSAHARLIDDGDVSLPGWTERAARLGHAVTLHELAAMVCGEAVCGDELAPFDVRFVLEIETPVVLTHPAECGALECGDTLGAYDAQRLENELNRVKQAHTLLQFIYT